MTQSASWYPAQVAGPVGALGPSTQASPQASPQVEIEGDGLEAQRPPRQRANTEPDDPSEPFSPNYGSVPLSDPAPPAAPA
jgi:hypothetical protein